MLSSNFSLQLIESPECDLYAKSITIYSKTTPIDIKTNTNEITYWIKNRNDKFDLYTFALIVNGENVGFAMTSYLKDNKILVFDYISLETECRNNAVFLSFFTLIKMYFQNIKLEIDYYLVEISNKNEGRDIDKESTLFLKFLCIENFSRINHAYISLPLGDGNFESTFYAFLYVKTNDKKLTISKDTFLMLVKALYNDYYLEWYKPFLDQQKIDNYRNIIKNNLKDLESNTKKTERIELIHHQCITNNNEVNYENETMPTIKSVSKKIFIALFIIIFAPIILVTAYNFILEYFGIPITSVNSLLGGIVSALITVIASIILVKKKS